MRVQYGCGLCAPVGWRNFDSSPTLRCQKIPLLGAVISRLRTNFPKNIEYGDVTRRLPVADRSCTAVYCSHVLEHLSFEGFRAALRESYRVLQPGGVFRGVMPDLEVIVAAYRDDPSPERASRFIRATMLGQERRPRGPVALAASLFGGADHRWLWDYANLEVELTGAGFTQVRRAEVGDDHADLFGDIEDPHRWSGHLGFQAVRPSGS